MCIDIKESYKWSRHTRTTFIQATGDAFKAMVVKIFSKTHVAIVVEVPGVVQYGALRDSKRTVQQLQNLPGRRILTWDKWSKQIIAEHTP